MAVCMLKAGGTCKPRPPPTVNLGESILAAEKKIVSQNGLTDPVRILGIQAGLGKPLTAVPLYLLTAKGLNIKG